MQRKCYVSCGDIQEVVLADGPMVAIAKAWNQKAARVAEGATVRLDQTIRLDERGFRLPDTAAIVYQTLPVLAALELPMPELDGGENVDS